MDFDLSAHNGDLAEGDSFTLDIPAPLSIDNDESNLFDQGVALGHISRRSKGPARGGTVTLTLQNLQQYLEATGTTTVENIRGNIYLPILVNSLLAPTDLPILADQTQGITTLGMEVVPPPNNNFGFYVYQENFTKKDGNLIKKDWQSERLGKGGKYWHAWTIRVNARQAAYGEYVIEDAVDPGDSPWQYIPEQLYIEAGYFNDATFLLYPSKQRLTEGVDYTVEYNSSYTAMKIRILDAATRMAANGFPAAYYIQYKSTAPADGTNITNRVKVSADGTELPRNIYQPTMGQSMTVPSKPTDAAQLIVETAGRVVIYKRDNQSGDLLPGARFRITSPLGNTEEVVTDANGRAVSKKYEMAEFGTFTVEEIEAPPGYRKLMDTFRLTLGEKGVARTVDNEQILIPLTLSKHWVDEDNRYAKRPAQVRLTLYKTVEGVKTALREEILTAADVTADEKIWERAIGQFPTHERGKEITYSIEEEAVEDYRAEISTALPGAQFLSVANFFENNTAQLSGTKTWDDADNQDGLRPQEIVVQLLADGAEVAGQTAVVRPDANGAWKYSFSDLPKYRDGGTEIVYTVKEVSVPEGYTSEAIGMDLTNRYTPETIQINGQKIWKDADNQDGLRPSEITVLLMADGTEISRRKTDAASNWQFDFGSLPKYRAGQLIDYRLREETVAGYLAAFDGYIITNTHEPAMIDLAGVKLWKDRDDAAGKRPTKISLRLLADGQEVKKMEVRADANGVWKYRFGSFPRYQNGKEIRYTVEEMAVPQGYEAEVSGLDVINTYTQTPPSPNPTPNPDPTPSPNPNPTPAPDPNQGSDQQGQTDSQPNRNGQKPNRLIPRTGEKSHIGLIIAAVGSALGVIVILFLRRKRS